MTREEAAAMAATALDLLRQIREARHTLLAGDHGAHFNLLYSTGDAVKHAGRVASLLAFAPVHEGTRP